MVATVAGALGRGSLCSSMAGILEARICAVTAGPFGKGLVLQLDGRHTGGDDFCSDCGCSRRGL
eukprot:13017293-Alexandrium_andersonii.AAC.1